MRDKYDMSIAASLYSPKNDVTVASGYTDAGLGIGVKTRRAQTDDIYVIAKDFPVETDAAHIIQ